MCLAITVRFPINYHVANASHSILRYGEEAITKPK